MTRRAMTLAATAGVASAMLAGGCSGGAGSSANPTDETFIGIWIEDRSQAKAAPANVRIATPEKLSPKLRQITFADDHSYILVVCNPDGTPLDGAIELTGTWSVEEGNLDFLDVKENKLGAKYKEWMPDDYLGIEDVDGSPILRIYHRDGPTVAYKRVNG